MNLQNLCLGCMHELSPSAEVCPNCSRWVGEIQHAPLLPKKYVLEGRYFIGLSVDSSTDCVTYCALDLQSGRRVFVCELLPKNLIVRNEGETVINVRTGYEVMYNACFQSFIKLWKTLFSLNGEPALPNVKELFTANSTVYAVYETVESITLEAYLSAEKRSFEWGRVKAVFKPVLSALLALEKKGIVHAAVSPSSVLVGADGKLHLSGFSIPQTKSDVIELRAPSFAGYSPLELSDRRLSVGTYTDVYSAMAVMYTMLTGLTPQIAADRAVNDLMVIPNEFAKNLQKNSIEIILGALRVYPEKRIQSVEKLYSLLYPAQSEKAPSAEAAASFSKTEDEKASPKADEIRAAAPSKENGEKKPTLPEQVKEETESVVTFKAIAAALLIASMIFVTAYSTFLYRFFDVPFLDKALSAMTFLPLNGETKPSKTPSESTKEPSSSQEARTVTVADFSQLTYRDIQNNETFNRNFKIEFLFEPSTEVEKNSIISQSIPAGEHVPAGTAITIVVSTGKPYIVLRDVMGMKYEDAYELLTKDGFVVQKVIRENDGTRTPGTVYTMSLVAGLEFEKGTTVTLSVWSD